MKFYTNIQSCDTVEKMIIVILKLVMNSVVTFSLFPQKNARKKLSIL